MTEAEWLAGDHPAPMLKILRGRATLLKLRLLACGCCRRHWGSIREPGVRRKVELTEGDADIALAESDFAAAVSSPPRARGDARSFGARISRVAEAFGWRDTEPHPGRGRWEPGEYAEAHTMTMLFEVAVATTALNRGEESRAKIEREQTAQADLIRDIFGNPFRPVAADPRWWTSAAIALASAMYESRDFGALPILTDALQEAGCDHPDVLAHCRGLGPHVRGCWVVDLVLGKV